VTGTGAVASGTLGPSIEGASVSIVYTSPKGSQITHTESTDGSGSYRDTFVPTVKGTWHLQAHWPGDGTYLPSDSSECTLTFGAG